MPTQKVRLSPKIIEEINARYDAELAALEQQPEATVNTPQTLKEEYQGKFIYSTPGSGKSTIAVQDENIIDFDSIQAFENYPINLVLPYDQNHLTFHFVATDWEAPHKVKTTLDSYFVTDFIKKVQI